MTWEFADGTSVELGGKVTGTSLLAELLRQDVEDARNGGPRWVSVRPEPGGSEPLDVDDAQLVDAWCRWAAQWLDIPLTASPEVEPIEDDREPNDDLPEGAVVTY